MMGAISNKDKYFRFYIAPEGFNTNYVTVHDYFTNLHQERSLSGVVVVMDKHPAHSIETELLLKSLGAIVLKLPPSTSYFNPIEMCWAWIKR
jgi:transposase